MASTLSTLEYGGITDNDLSIDFTGGQKPASVVGAIASLNSLIQGQYIQTGAPWAALSYDLVEDPDAPQM